MLKRICKLLLLGMVVCAGSAYVTPTYASSADIILPSTERGAVLTHIYPATGDGATHEIVAFYNNTPHDIDITGWCIANKTNVPLGCFTSYPGIRLVLPSHAYAVLASTDYIDKLPVEQQRYVDVSYVPTSRSSGSIVGGADTITLKDSLGRVVDVHSWTTALAKTQGFIRNGFDEEVHEYIAASSITNQPLALVMGGDLYEVVDETYQEETPLPEGEDQPEGDQEDAPLRLSEIYPNPKGTDTGVEFIELYNPSDSIVDLSRYAVRVQGGVTEKTFTFPAAEFVAEHSFRSFTSSDMKFTLNNTSGSIILLYDGVTIDEAIYDKPKEGASWAYFDGEWRYTFLPTPGASNAEIAVPAALAKKETARKPCAPDQYRNPETGRCKKNAVPKTQTPCKEGQYRSAETGRCRSAATKKAPAPCKENQERNPETNRCRNIKKMSGASDAIKPNETQRAGGVAWYAWIMIGLIIVGIAAYGAWEWRHEIGSLVQKVRGRSA